MRGHPGLLTASALETPIAPLHTGGGHHSHRPNALYRHLLLAVEPDCVWVQPMPVLGQPPLSAFAAVTGPAGGTSLSKRATTTATTVSSEEVTKSGESIVLFCSNTRSTCLLSGDVNINSTGDKPELREELFTRHLNQNTLALTGDVRRLCT